MFCIKMPVRVLIVFWFAVFFSIVLILLLFFVCFPRTYVRLRDALNKDRVCLTFRLAALAMPFDDHERLF